MADNSGPIIIIGVVVVVALLFGGTIVAFVSGAIPNVTAWFEDIISQIRGVISGGGDTATGMSSVAFRVYFADGSTPIEINQDMSYSILPLSISFQGKTVSQIEVDVLVRMSGANIGAWNTNTTIHTELYKKPETVPKTWASGSFVDGGTSWSPGAKKTVAKYIVEASLLDDAADDYGDGDYLLQVTADLALNVNVDGIAQTYEASPMAGGVDIAYSDGEPSGMSFSVSRLPLG